MLLDDQDLGQGEDPGLGQEEEALIEAIEILEDMMPEIDALEEIGTEAGTEKGAETENVRKAKKD